MIRIFNKILIIAFLLSFSYSLYAKDAPLADTKCGTWVSKEQKLALNMRLQIVDKRPGSQQRTVSSPSSFFAVHFDTTGYDRVSPIDNNKNGVPDYVDSVCYYFDKALSMECDSIGYQRPPADNMSGGTDQFDIYLMNIGNDTTGANGYYGLTTRETQIMPSPFFPRWTSWIVIDNDFGSGDSIITEKGKRRSFADTGVSALKITAAHEFHHAIQFGLGLPDEPFSTIYEMTSVWMEKRLYPETLDYLQYAKALFLNPSKYPFGVSDNYAGYCWSVFGQYMYKRWGDQTMLRTWQLIAKGIRPYDAIDSSLKEQGTNLQEAWLAMLPWLYYTAGRTKDSSYFDDALLLPEFNQEKLSYSDPSVSKTGKTASFEVAGFRFLLPPSASTTADTLDAMISNIDLYAASQQFNSNKPYYVICSSSQSSSNYQRIGDTKYFYAFNASDGNVVDTTFNNRGSLTQITNFVFPSPWHIKSDNELNFYVPPSAGLNQSVILTIYGSDMSTIGSDRFIVTAINTPQGAIRGVTVDKKSMNNLLETISPAVYLFSVKFADDEIIGKFIIMP